MSLLDDLIGELLVREGWPVYTNDPSDHGGPTKGGITLADLSAWRKKKCTAKDVEALEEPEARAIYVKKYILDPKFDGITDAWVLEFVFDTGVLQGQGEAARMLQQVLGVAQDGDIGPTTLAALQNALRNPRRLHLSLIRARMHLLLDDMVFLIPAEQRQTTNLKYRHGWWNRVADFME